MEGIVNKFGVVVVVSAGLEVWLVDKSSEIFGLVYSGILTLKPLSWNQFVPNWVFLTDRLSRRIAVRF